MSVVRGIEPGPGTWPDDLIALYREQGRRMVRLAYLLTSDPAASEELVHEAFLATFSRWEAVREPGPYLRAAVVNGCRSFLRRRAVERRRASLERDVPALLEADEMWDALGRLSIRRRTAIVLRYYEDLPDPEIARILGCRTPTVRTAIHRGLQDLRKEIEP